MSTLVSLSSLAWNHRRCKDCDSVFERSYGHRSDLRCCGCDYRHKERTVNPLQMGNRHNHQFSGEDMRFYRFTVRDNGNLLTVREAKKLGMVCKREGRFSRYYDANGTLLCAYSYNTCIYARIFDEVEGDWRDVFNFTPYSKTTNEHVDAVMRETVGITHHIYVNGYTQAYKWSEQGFTGEWSPRLPLSKRVRRIVELVCVEVNSTAEELVGLVKRGERAQP